MYQDLEAELHDLFWNAEAPGVELKMIKNFLSDTQEKVLEIGCGSGRLLLPLLDLGYAIDGQDISEDMLNLLDKNKQNQHQCKLLNGDVMNHDLTAYRHFLIPAFTLMLMGEKGGDVLAYISQQATPGSTLFLTTFMPWAEICGELEEGEWYRDHEVKIAKNKKAWCDTQFEIDRTNQILQRKHKYTLEENGVSRTHYSQQQLRWYSYQELLTLMDLTGWHVNERIFDFDEISDGENAHLFSLMAVRK